MASTRLLQTVCTVAMLVGGSALAQPITQPADTGPNTTVNKPGARSGSRADMMGSPDRMMGRSGSHPAMEPHASHGSTMAHPSRPMHGGSDTSQNDAVSRLNDQSYQAAQSGQPFNGGAGGMGAGGMGGGGTGAGGTGGGGAGGAGAGGMGGGGMGAGGMGGGGTGAGGTGGGGTGAGGAGGAGAGGMGAGGMGAGGMGAGGMGAGGMGAGGMGGGGMGGGGMGGGGMGGGGAPSSQGRPSGMKY